MTKGLSDGCKRCFALLSQVEQLYRTETARLCLNSRVIRSWFILPSQTPYFRILSPQLLLQLLHLLYSVIALEAVLRREQSGSRAKFVRTFVFAVTEVFASSAEFTERLDANYLVKVREVHLQLPPSVYLFPYHYILGKDYANGNSAWKDE